MLAVFSVSCFCGRDIVFQMFHNRMKGGKCTNLSAHIKLMSWLLPLSGTRVQSRKIQNQFIVQN